MAATRSSLSGYLQPANTRPGADPRAVPGSVSGSVRPGRRTKLLVKHLRRGDVALIDHLDIDRVSAEELIAAGTAAVINCKPSSGGSYPNLGPQLLVEAGILLVDVGDDALFDELADGDPVVVIPQAPEGGRASAQILRRGELLARGELLDLERVCAETEARRLEIGEALERFAHNTIEHMREERELLAGRIELPRFATDFRDRSTLVVVRGVGHQRDLRALRPFIRDMRPLIVAVDGGADALLEAGYRPHVIIGDMDSVSDDALDCGAELVVHAYPDGRAPGRARLTDLDLDAAVLPAAGTSEDVAMLLADALGASLIAVVGTHWTLEGFLSKGRPGMSSTFLTHLRVGDKVVNARGVHQLYQSRISWWALLGLVLAAAFTLVVAVASSPAGQILGNYFSATWHTFSYWFTGLFR
jgi:uncharacterized membrane-anchored protein